MLTEKLTTVRLGFNQSKILSFSASPTHCVCSDSDNKIWIWGENKQGELSLGDSYTHSKPTHLPHLTDKKIVKVVAGEGYTVIFCHNLLKTPV